MKKTWMINLLGFTAWLNNAAAQCEVAIDTTDAFDTTRTIVTSAINVGYLIPSEYLTPDTLPKTARAFLQAGGLKPGNPVLLYGDGYPKIWDRYEETFDSEERIEILDERHARTNLRKMAEWSYPNSLKEQTRWLEKRMDNLYQGRYEQFFYALDYLVKRCEDAERRDKLKTKRHYFRKNQHRIRQLVSCAFQTWFTP